MRVAPRQTVGPIPERKKPKIYDYIWDVSLGSFIFDDDDSIIIIIIRLSRF